MNEEYLTVVFHAILSEKFKKGREGRVVISGDDPIFNGWNNTAVEINKIK